jgi:ADP-ribose pyrophosphatase
MTIFAPKPSSPLKPPTMNNRAIMRPWKKISVKTIRLNRFRSLLKKRYQLPNGHVDDYYIINTGKIVCALVLTKNRQVVLARQFRPGPERIMFELPGGMVDRHENPTKAIIREVLEETGYCGTVRLVGTSTDDGWSTKLRYHFVITNAVKIEMPHNERSEITEAVLMPLSAFRRHIQTDRLTDSETAYRCLNFLKLL